MWTWSNLGVPYMELLILIDKWTNHRLLPQEKQLRSTSILDAVWWSPDIDTVSGETTFFLYGDETRQVSKEIQSVTQKQRPSRETCVTRVPDHFRSRGRWTITAMGSTTFQER